MIRLLAVAAIAAMLILGCDSDDERLDVDLVLVLACPAEVPEYIEFDVIATITNVGSRACTSSRILWKTTIAGQDGYVDALVEPIADLAPGESTQSTWRPMQQSSLGVTVLSQIVIDNDTFNDVTVSNNIRTIYVPVP